MWISKILHWSRPHADFIFVWNLTTGKNNLVIESSPVFACWGDGRGWLEGGTRELPTMIYVNINLDWYIS